MDTDKMYIEFNTDKLSMENIYLLIQYHYILFFIC